LQEEEGTQLPPRQFLEQQSVASVQDSESVLQVLLATVPAGTTVQVPEVVAEQVPVREQHWLGSVQALSTASNLMHWVEVQVPVAESQVPKQQSVPVLQV
jgi:hypothetical protein